MYHRVRESVFAVLYALSAVGLVYCCGVCLWRLGTVPGQSRVLYVLLVAFGGYGAWLCAQTSVEITQSVLKRGDDELGQAGSSSQEQS